MAAFTQTISLPTSVEMVEVLAARSAICFARELNLEQVIVEGDSEIIIKAICREGKIPDLSQANTLYYQVHKIQPITKHHVLLLGFVITTQKPTEICQVSCKNQSHLGTCKR